MRMRPPHDGAVTYNSAPASPDGTFEILDGDVAALEAEGWTLSEESPAPTEGED